MGKFWPRRGENENGVLFFLQIDAVRYQTYMPQTISDSLFLVTRGLRAPDNLHMFMLCTCVSYTDVVLHEDVVHFVLVTWRCSTRSSMVHLH